MLELAELTTPAYFSSTFYEIGKVVDRLQLSSMFFYWSCFGVQLSSFPFQITNALRLFKHVFIFFVPYVATNLPPIFGALFIRTHQIFRMQSFQNPLFLDRKHLDRKC